MEQIDSNSNPQPNMSAEPQPSVPINLQVTPEPHPQFKPVVILIILGVLIAGYFVSAKYAFHTWPFQVSVVTTPSPTPTPSPSPTSDETANWQTYTSKAGWYQVQYPGWWKANGGDKSGFVFLRGDSNVVGDKKSDIFSNPADNPFGNLIVIAHCHGLEYCKREMEDSLKFMIDTSNITLNGLSAIKGNHKVPEGVYKTIVLIPKVIVTEPYEDAYYEIRLDGDLKNLLIFEKMISTFKFTK